MLTAILHHALAGDGVPEWVHLVPGGTFRGIDGRGPYTLANAQAVIAASLPAGEKLPIDENHSTDLAAPNGEPSPARGWIVAMEPRADGIWGRVEWNESGRALIADKAYRGISPVFAHDKAGRVTRVLRAALTNNPNLHQLATLNHQEPNTMDLARMRSLLGLPADADEAAIVAAMEAQTQERTALNAKVSSLEGRITTMQATAIKPDLVIELQAQIATLQSDRARERAAAFVDGAIKAGKPIVAVRDHYIARHMQAPADVEKEINALPSLHSGGLGGQPIVRHDAPDGDADDTDMFVARKMGLDPKKLAEHRKKLRDEKKAA